MAKRIYEMVQTQGHPKRFLAESIKDALNHADPLAGEVLKVELFDSRTVDESTSKVWLDKVFNFEDLTIKGYPHE